ncbi:partner of xrn-2 protein 1-like isoform X1 [Tachypleus tridentatus]|uniref:partner of xrn-2 protein 1-like isoform X1 n=2 Tax=Tachypleus tridentatus TaxID=6853 RepID=UPI003FCFA74A
MFPMKSFSIKMIMTDCSNFDVEMFRQPWESDEHWVMRRDFLLTHSNKLPLNRLLCLAQVFVNVELLGCRYPIPVMRQVAELSKDINSARDLNSKRQDRTQIHFVMSNEAKRSQPVKRTSKLS